MNDRVDVMATEAQTEMLNRALRLLKEAAKNADHIGCAGAWLLETLNLIAQIEGRATKDK